MVARARPNRANAPRFFALPKSRPVAKMSLMSYQPQPISTQDVDLPSALLSLTEGLAENTHDLWASPRLAQGWRFGLHRDDAQKLHPCLVPYADLPDSEKEYDRIATLGTLKAILKL